MPTKKNLPINKLAKALFSLKKRKKRIVFTNGCFDILHYGHVFYLSKAKNLGDILVVGVNSDSSIKTIKEPARPINPLGDRMGVLASLECVDYLCSFNEPTPINLIKKIRPDILVKGGDWKKNEIIGSEFVKSYGGKVITIPFRKGYSTTKLIKKIKSM